ncbi:hypothetical protein MNBD_CPR01-495 [hydrothermal vent metagenome]|uniref:Uncharacterized protein n=1 Tax=hydrothermal vent metagenome TaxID=652676 RepID=A0A3B0V0R4_9ZZZZ
MEDVELRDLLEENLNLAKENNRLLKSARRAVRLSFIGKLIFWIIVLGIPTYLYMTYFAPMISSIMSSAGITSGGSITKVFGLPSVESVTHALDTFKTISHTATQTVQNVTTP